MIHLKDPSVTTAQVHVSYISKQIDVLISEATLRGLFSLYGEVVDVALKKSQFDRVRQFICRVFRPVSYLIFV
jgi:hypothetical protein